MSVYFDTSKNRWRFEFYKVVNGRRVRSTKVLPRGWNRAQAQAYDQKQTNKLYDAATGITKDRVLIETAVVLYCQHHLSTRKDGDGITKELARIYWSYKGRYLDELAEVGRDFCANAYFEIKTPDGSIVQKQYSAASIKNKLSYLRAACRYAQSEHGMGDPELRLAISVPTVSNERQFYADRAEMLKLARACRHRHARAIIRIGFYSGMRLGEMMALGRTARVVGNGFVLPNESTKTGEPRIVPIHPKIRVLCKYLPIPYKKRWMQRVIRQTMDLVGLQHLVLHDVRHSSASAMINNEVDLNTVGKVLGHKDLRSTQRYAHLATKSLEKAILKIK